MSIECAECERDLRGGHDPSCSRYRPALKEPAMTMPINETMSDLAKQNPDWFWFNMVTATFEQRAYHPSQALYIRADLVDDLVKAAEEARGAVKITECPRPISGPDDMEAQACVAAGECGCCYGVAIAKIDAALARIADKEK